MDHGRKKPFAGKRFFGRQRRSKSRIDRIHFAGIDGLPARRRPENGDERDQTGPFEMLHMFGHRTDRFYFQLVANRIGRYPAARSREQEKGYATQGHPVTHSFGYQYIPVNDQVIQRQQRCRASGPATFREGPP